MSVLALDGCEPIALRASSSPHTTRAPDYYEQKRLPRRKAKVNVHRARWIGPLPPWKTKVTMQRVRWIGPLPTRKGKVTMQRMRWIGHLPTRKGKVTVQRVRWIVNLPPQKDKATVQRMWWIVNLPPRKDKAVQRVRWIVRSTVRPRKASLELRGVRWLRMIQQRSQSKECGHHDGRFAQALTQKDPVNDNHSAKSRYLSAAGRAEVK